MIRALSTAFLLLALPVSAAAQVATSPPASGLYEAWSSLRMSAVGPLGAPPPVLTEWIEVQTSGDLAVVTFLPERRVVWRIRYDAQGPIEKVVEVDGEHFITARYTYDAAGHLARKEADGPARTTPLVFSYRTDASGRVIERRSPLRQALFSGSAPGAEEVVTVRYRGARAHVRTELAGRLVREDDYDAAARITATRFFGARRGMSASLIYRRDASGALLGVERVVGRRRGAADPRVRDASVDAELVALVAGAPIERAEALLLLGSPVRASDDARGLSRRRSDDWADACWLNEISGISWDPTGLVASPSSGCICGFCVDAELAVSEADVLGVDLHWTRGPWVRLDGEVVLTADHEVMTPAGPRAAGELEVGDVVLDAGGGERVLRTVEALGEELRLGRNVRTATGTFVVGGIVVASEAARTCE